MRIALKDSGSLGFSKKLKMSRIGIFLFLTATETKLGNLARSGRRQIGEVGRATRPIFSTSLFGYSSAACVLARRAVAGLDELDVQAERLELLDEDVEALGQTRLERVLALDDGLVHPRAAHDVVALDGEELLERVRGAVRFHRPDFHLAEPLPAELRLAAQRLLRDERVRTDRARVDLVVDEVVELEHVHHAHGDLLVERLAGAAVEEHRLTARREPGERERVLDLPPPARRRTRGSRSGRRA